MDTPQNKKKGKESGEIELSSRVNNGILNSYPVQRKERFDNAEILQTSGSGTPKQIDQPETSPIGMSKFTRTEQTKIENQEDTLLSEQTNEEDDIIDSSISKDNLAEVNEIETKKQEQKANQQKKKIIPRRSLLGKSLNF